MWLCGCRFSFPRWTVHNKIVNRKGIYTDVRRSMNSSRSLKPDYHPRNPKMIHPHPSVARTCESHITTVEPCYLELGYLKHPVISNSNPFPLPLFFSHLLSAISNSPLSRTQTHSPCPCFSVIYYHPSWPPRYLEIKPFPLPLFFSH